MAESREWVVATVVGVAMLWKLMCVWLRTRRAKLIASFSPIEDVHTVHEFTGSVEFPFIFNMSLQFALFRSYAVPSISKILAKTGNFAANAAKRADDTEILLREASSHHVDSDRGTAALRRLNYIHGQFPNIKNEDYLYVLALFVMEPVRWISQYGYRHLTTSECVANFVIWRDYAVRMGVKDIPLGIEELEEWQLKYEAEQMVYADTNREIADVTVALLLKPLPKATWPVIRPLIFAMLDDRLRVAFGYPKQPQWLTSLAKALLRFVNGTCVAMFLPPRPLSWAVNRISVDVNEDGARFDVNRPRKLAFDPYGSSSYPNGYKISEVGPGKPGALGEAFQGELLCPLSERYFRTPWPPRSDGRCAASNLKMLGIIRTGASHALASDVKYRKGLRKLTLHELLGLVLGCNGCEYMTKGLRSFRDISCLVLVHNTTDSRLTTLKTRVMLSYWHHDSWNT